MFRPRMCRLFAALSLVVGVGAALPGCGGDPKPTSEKAAEKKGDVSTANPTPTDSPKDNPSPDMSVKMPEMPAPLQKIDTRVGVGSDAEKFLTVLHNGGAKADMLSSRFVKGIGLPAVFPDDKAKGYSPDSAEGWLKRAGLRHSFGPFLYSKQVGDVAFFRGPIFGELSGTYAMRMVHENNTWKVDWLSLSSAKVNGAELNGGTGEAVAQEFAAAAVMSLVCDREALIKEDRAAVLAYGMTPALKAKWAEPLDSDKKEGFDYNRGLLAQKASEFARDVTEIKVEPVAGMTAFNVEVDRGTGARTFYLVKLVKGPGSGDWLVDDIAERK